jgi:threonine dehydratase
MPNSPDLKIAPISRQELAKAVSHVFGYIDPTPVMYSPQINTEAGAEISFKMENFTAIGAFKARGAIHALLSAMEEARAKDRNDKMISNGVATFSSGNHAQAVAWAARQCEKQCDFPIPTYVVMPRNAKEVKKRGVRELGGEIVDCGDFGSRESKLKEVLDGTGALFIPPFDNYRVIAGQATATRELIRSVHPLDEIVVPVGGGGLISGAAMAVHHSKRDIKVIGAEPEGADDAFRSLQMGERQKNASVNTIADGLLTSLGEKTYPVIRDFVDRIDAVSDPEIIRAMRLMWDRLKVIVEPSGAVGLAAILKNPEAFKGKRIGVIVSGGNVDLDEALEMMKSK